MRWAKYLTVRERAYRVSVLLGELKGLPPQVAERLEVLRARPIESAEKGFAFMGEHGANGPTAASIAAARPQLYTAGLTYPLLTLRESALRANAEAMARFCDRAGVDLAPHGKTGMSPELAALQLAHGAWAITAATIGQMRTYRGFGFPRLLLANELVDETGIAWLMAALAGDPGFQAYCYIDTVKNIDILARTIRGSTPGHARPVRPLPVLVEIGHSNGRTGCRTDAEALEVAKAAAATGTLRVAGVAGYEGTIHADDATKTLAAVTSFCRRLRGVADALREFSDGTEEFIVTAGGSRWFDVVARELTSGDVSGLRVVLRSGAYLYYDHGLYSTVSPQARGTADTPRLRPAIELWAQVLSRPEPDLALLGFGRRDASFDSGLPVPLQVVPADGGAEPEVTPNWRITALDDQHAYLRLDEDASLAPGDRVCLGISHPCTTLDKWRVIPVVDDTGHITDVVHAFF
jgi:D-serine deaminase-like pyridoxal phosphate-dependent protein